MAEHLWSPSRKRSDFLLRAHVSPLVVAAVAALLFAGVFAWRAAYGASENAPLVLFVVPIALCAIEFGLRGGVAGALLALGLLALGEASSDDDLGALGLATRATAYLVVGVLLGRFVDAQRRLEAEVERHFDLSLDLCCTADFSGHFQRLNPAWQKALGYTPAALKQRPFVEFVHPDDRDATTREAAKLAETREDTVNFRNRYRAADGDYRWLEWNCRGVADQRLIYAIARDVTEHQREEERLEQAVRERTRALDDARLETLRRLALAAEYRDDDTYEHTERVGRTAALLALGLDLAEEIAALLRRAAPLHDVGKLGIPDSILLKPGKLTPEEFRLMQEHVTIGGRILSEGKFAILRMGEQVALSHHERWDGSGYPNGLAGERIPLAGRVVAVADVFDALTHDRPYKEAWPVDKAVAEIVEQAGRHFAPRVVEAFAALDHWRLLAPLDDFDVTLTSPPGTVRA